MEPESGREPPPPDDDTHRSSEVLLGDGAAAPEGWIRIGGDFIPDPSHPLYPFKRGGRREEAIADRLARNAAVMRSVDDVAAGFAETDARWRAAPLSGRDHLDAVIRTLAALAVDAAARSCPPGVTHATCGSFIIERALLRLGWRHDIAALMRSALAPVHLRLEGATGDIVMRFQDATPTDLRACKDLIKTAQRFLGHEPIRTKRGRTPLEDDPETQAVAIKAAKLFHWDGITSMTEIVKLLDLAEPGEKPYDRSATRRAESLVTAGNRGMTDKHGADWTKHRSEIEPIERDENS